MAVSLMNLNAYSRLFSSPASNLVSPTANLIYGGAVSSMYAKRLSDSLQSDMSSFLSSLNTRTYELQSASKPLIESSKDNVYDSRTISSSSSAVSASVFGGAATGKYTFSVSRLAAAQKNKGSEMYSNVTTSMSEGTYTLRVSVGEKDKDVSFEIKSGDSNKDTLDSMAEAVNRADIGITARVVSSNSSRTSHLEISSDKTGTENSFSITDVSGDAAARTGISSVSQNAVDAEYRLNSEEHTSQSNTISLDDGKLSVTFNSVTQQEAVVTVTENKEAVLEAVKAFAQSFNQAISFSGSSGRYAVANRLNDELKSIVSSKQGSLGGIGITVKGDGSLAVDERRLSKVLENNPDQVRRVLGGYEGTASRVSKLADRTLASTALDSTGRNLYKSDFSSFYNYLKNANKNVFMRNQSMGIFVDALL